MRNLFHRLAFCAIALAALSWSTQAWAGMARVCFWNQSGADVTLRPFLDDEHKPTSHVVATMLGAQVLLTGPGGLNPEWTLTVPDYHVVILEMSLMGHKYMEEGIESDHIILEGVPAGGQPFQMEFTGVMEYTERVNIVQKDKDNKEEIMDCIEYSGTLVEHNPSACSSGKPVSSANLLPSKEKSVLRLLKSLPAAESQGPFGPERPAGEAAEGQGLPKA